KVKISTRAKVLKKAAAKIKKQRVFEVESKNKAIETEKIQSPIPKIIRSEIKNPIIRSQNARLSRHILDLKKTSKFKNGEPTEKEEKAYSQIYAEFKNKEKCLRRQVNEFGKNIKKTLSLSKKQNVSSQ